MSVRPNEPAPSAREQTRAARVGAALFAHRGWLPVPFILVPLLIPGRMTATSWTLGLLLVVVGEAVRMAGVAAAGSETRRRSRRVTRLVTYGAFAWSRNPLYVGNYLIWMGFMVVSGVYWAVVLGTLVFALEYSLIVRYEEGVLESFFGEAYLAYKARTPRWLPRPSTRAERGPHDWPAAWRSEISTFLAYATLVAAMAVKQRMVQ